jgi:hypothetical protein
MANRIIGSSILKKQSVKSRTVMSNIYLSAYIYPVITDCPEVCINAGFAYLSQGKDLYSKKAKEYFLTAQKLDVDNLYEHEIGVGLRQATDSSTHATEFYAYYLEE